MVDRNINWHFYRITRQDRENLHQHRSIVLWFTGLSGSGKSSLANILEENLHYKGISTYILDGDNIRYGLCSDLEFSDRDRYENMRRAGEVAKLMFDAGLVVLATFISPFKSERQMLRNMFPDDCFLEIFLDTPIQICKHRDSKGLYEKALSGEIKNFTGINAPYEKPEQPDVYLSGKQNISDLIEKLFNIVIKRIFIKIAE